MEVIGLSKKLYGRSETAVKSRRGWMAIAARCNKIQVEADEKSVWKAWLGASRRKAVLVRTNMT